MVQVTAGQEIESEVVLLCKMTIKPRLRSATCCSLVEVNSVSSLALDFVTLLFKNGQMWVTVCTHLWLEDNSLYLPLPCPSIPDAVSSASRVRRPPIQSRWTRGLASSRTEAERRVVRYNCWSLDIRQLCHTSPSHITFHDVNAFCWSTAFRTPYTSAGSPAMGRLLAR